MKLCSRCRKTPWPFLFALFIAGITAFLTWLMLTLSDFSMTERLIATALIFLAAAATLMHYVLSCMRRHCRHDHHHHQGGHHQAAG
jgi:CDP-diglyceride synthetase